MSKKCSNCGFDMADDAVFCTECGTRMEAPKQNTTEQPQPQNAQTQNQNSAPNSQQNAQTQNQYSAPNSQQNAQPQNQYSAPNSQQNAQPQNQYSAPYNQQYAQPQPNYYSQSPEDYAQNAVVTTGAFFGLNLLFSLPAIGWIICLIMSFAPKNKNIKNFARSKLIWIAIGIILGIIAGVIFSAVFKELGIDMDSYFSGYGYTM